MTPFDQTLARHGASLVREAPSALVVNTGVFCNQACAHCHHHAGPGETEIMDLDTARHVTDFVKRAGIGLIDITGGAPEFSEAALYIMEELAPVAEILFRTNLTALNSRASKVDAGFFAARKIRLAASFPSPDKDAFEAQRGRLTFDLAVSAFKRLNAAGYGQPGTGLSLDIAVNPSGPELPRDQHTLEEEFRQRLWAELGLCFNGLCAFANMPLGRFRERLSREKLRENYLEMLETAFNPASVPGLMCKNSLAADYAGILYDCDFNIAANLPLSGTPVHVKDFSAPFGEGLKVAVEDHCYACAAGAGFT